MKKKVTMEIDTPSQNETLSAIEEAICICYETKMTQEAILELDGIDSGNSIVITVKYKRNKNANKSIN